MAPLLSVTGLRKNFGPVEVLKGIDFDVRAGEKIALIGPSGSRKSTCLRCLNFLEKPSDGEIRLDGERIGVHNGRIMGDRHLAPQRAEMGMVFQLFNLWPHLSVTENVAIAARKVRKLSAKAARELALEMLAKVHMTHRADASPLELSGGQQQRVAIARALAQKPKLMLFDEPTSALDPELVNEVLKVMEELAAEGRTMIIVTHEIAFARDIADRVLFLDGGAIVEQGPARDLILSPREARTQAFLRKIRH
ncbi:MULTISPECIES: amino acid ABC transporter ATP-binding protein [Rhizobium]|uniref:Polar amino acid transport system ATP-binding protein n=1 Tax=Rhizobium paranaense TaxID=1650438 RepID=A0A7W8XSA7_9HYPH|nr:polar amino acid transport system ATP-binding protein [Rhizobium paranaense]